MSSDNLKKRTFKKLSSFFGTSEDFKTRFSKVMKVLFPLLLFCHAGSMFFGYFVIESSISDTLGGTLFDQSVLLSFLAVLAVLVIESGFSISATNTIDPILNPKKGFATIWHVLFFLVFLGGIIFMFDYSKEISEKGAELKGKALRTPYVKKESNHIVKLRDIEKGKIESKYSKSKSNTNKSIDNSANTLTLKYKGAIEAKRRKSKSDYKLYLSNKVLYKWANSTSKRYENQAAKIEGERDMKIAEAKEPFNKQIAILAASEINELNAIDSIYKEKMLLFESGENKIFADVDSQINFMGGAGKKLGLGLVCAAFILTFLQRVYIRATGENYLEEIFGKDKGMFVRYMIVFKKIIEFPFAALLDILEFLTGRDLNGDGKIGGVLSKLFNGTKGLINDSFKKKTTDSTNPQNQAPNIQNVANTPPFDAKDIEAIAAMAAKREIEKTKQKTKQKTEQKPSKDSDEKREARVDETIEESDNNNIEKTNQKLSCDTDDSQEEKQPNSSPIESKNKAETNVASGVQTILMRDNTTVPHYDEKKEETIYYNLSQIDSRITTYERKINQSKTNLEKAKTANDKRRIIQHEDALTNREQWKVYWNEKKEELLSRMKVV